MKATKTQKATFADLVKAVNTDPKDPKALLDLATATAYSVLKKCIDVSSNAALQQVRRDLTSVLHNLDSVEYVSDTFGEGLDLVHTAVITFLEEISAQKEREPDLPVDLERVYIARRMSRKVWVKANDSVSGWKTVETSPIKEVYRAVRRYISQTAAISIDPGNGYTYIEDLSADPDSDSDSVIYRRLSKYADLGGYVADFSGAPTVYTAAAADVEEMDDLIDRLHLTPRQKKILDLRISGYGYKAIGTYLGIRPDSVRDTIKAVQKKARAAGLDLTKYAEATATATAPTETATATAPTEKMYIDIPHTDFELVYSEYLYHKWLKSRNIFNHR